MATPVIMPRQGQSVESCIIGEWHKKKGDPVQEGDLLFTYETDKATFDEAAKVSGTLIEVYFEEGDDVPVLTNVCVIGEPGEDTSAFNPHQGEKEAKPDTDEAPAAAPAEPAPAKASVASSQVAAPALETTEDMAVSPRARKLAQRAGADLRFAVPTGPQGRVIERDVQAVLDQGHLATAAAGTGYPAQTAGTGLGGRVSTADVEAALSMQAPLPVAGDTWTEKHTNIRKIIARAMHESLATMAQLTLHSSYDASDVMALRARLKAAGAKGLGAEQGFALAEAVPTFNDIILYAVSRVLSRHPVCNAHYDDEKTTYFRPVHLGVAVDTPRGLMVPTLFHADSLTLAEISTQVRALAAASLEGTINPDLLQGATFTVTNLGTLGVEAFTPVINPPQTCILGVNTITTRVRDEAGQAVPYPSMGLSLTFDHRAVDGAPAARLLKDLVQVLEQFSLFLMH